MARTEGSTREVTAGRRVYGAQSLVEQLLWVLVHRPGAEYTAQLWREWGFDGEPDAELAGRQHDAFVALLQDKGVRVDYLREDASLQCTATYDPALVTDQGAVMLRSGRVERRAEVEPMRRRLEELGIPTIGALTGDACMDGGDTVWLDRETLLLGRGYRTNDEGISQVSAILGGIARDIHVFDLPHWEGPGLVLHLMSVLSPVDHDLAVVYRRLCPIRLIDLLLDRGYELVDVPDSEWDSLGSNILALAPRVAVITEGNPVTAERLREHGAEVHEVPGDELSVRRVSGPTCNTRPLLRG